MQFLGLLLAITTAFLVWQRLKAQKQEEDTVIDATDRFRPGLGPIAAIRSPVTAAAALVRLVVGADVWPMARGRLKVRLAEVSTDVAAEEAMAYAEWAARQVVDEGQALATLTEFLRTRLTLSERQDLAGMLEDAAASGEDADRARASREAIALVN